MRTCERKIEPMQVIYDLDEGKLAPIAHQIAADGDTEHAVFIIKQIAEREHGGFIPALFTSPQDGCHPATFYPMNCGCQYDDSAMRSAITTLRVLAPVAGDYESLAWAMYGRAIKFVYFCIRNTTAKGVPHSVNTGGVSIQSRRFEPAGILSIREAADIYQECIIAASIVDEKYHKTLRQTARACKLFMEATRGIGSLGPDEWPRYVWDGEADGANQLNIYDPDKPGQWRGDWPIRWAGFEPAEPTQ